MMLPVCQRSVWRGVPHLRGGALLMLGLWAPSPLLAKAGPGEVDLQLILLVDVSGSVNAAGRQVQRDGYVAAFRDPGITEAIQSGAVGRIMVTYVEWAGLREQVVVVPWTLVASAADAARFADDLARQPVGRGRGTSISVALAFAARLFSNSPVRGGSSTCQAMGRTMPVRRTPWSATCWWRRGCRSTGCRLPCRTLTPGR